MHDMPGMRGVRARDWWPDLACVSQSAATKKRPRPSCTTSADERTSSAVAVTRSSPCASCGARRFGEEPFFPAILDRLAAGAERWQGRTVGRSCVSPLQARGCAFQKHTCSVRHVKNPACLCSSLEILAQVSEPHVWQTNSSSEPSSILGPCR